MPKFSDRLKELQTQKRVSQKDTAKAAGVTARSIQYYEKEQKEPTLSVLVRIPDYFDVSLDYLVGRSDNPQRQ